MTNSTILKSLNRRTYQETEDFRIWLEDISDQLFVHVEIYNATKGAVQQIKEGWAELLIDCYFQGYENLFCYTKDNRIVKMMGGAKKIGEHDGYEVWQWVLN